MNDTITGIQIPSRTWWEMRRLKYNILVGGVGFMIVILVNLYIKHGTTFDPVFFFTSIAIAIIYAIICNLTYTGIWLLDDLSFGNELVAFHSPKRTIILYVFVFLSCLIPFGIMLVVKNLL
jgi:hypothetical protein